MRYRDLEMVYYRSVDRVVDEHFSVKHEFSKTLSSIMANVQPEVLKTDIHDVGSLITGNILVYVPKAHNRDFSVKRGDGFYLKGDDVDTQPSWYVSNVPFPYIKHYLLVLKNKVE